MLQELDKDIRGAKPMMTLSSHKKGQEVSNLYPFILLIILVGMVIGVGVLTLDKFGSTVYYTRTGYNDTVTILNYTAQDLDYGNVTVSAVWNDTKNLLPASCYSINATDGHFIYTNETAACDVQGSASFYVIYDFKEYNTQTRNALASATDELDNIPSDWMGLIVTVFVLSLLLYLVIRSFNPGRT